MQLYTDELYTIYTKKTSIFKSAAATGFRWCVMCKSWLSNKKNTTGQVNKSTKQMDTNYYLIFVRGGEQHIIELIDYI